MTRSRMSRSSYSVRPGLVEVYPRFCEKQDQLMAQSRLDVSCPASDQESEERYMYRLHRWSNTLSYRWITTSEPWQLLISIPTLVSRHRYVFRMPVGGPYD